MKRQLFASIVNMTTEERSKLHREMENCNKVQTKVESCNEAPHSCDQEPPPPQQNMKLNPRECGSKSKQRMEGV